MIGSATGPRGIGLAVLLQTGLCGWLRAVRIGADDPHPERLSTDGGTPDRPLTPPVSVLRGPLTAVMPQAQYTEAARLIASLVLSGRTGPGPLRG